MQDDSFSLDDAVAVLERTPASLSGLLAHLGERWVKATEGDGSWSPYEVIVHLINGERTNWMVRVRLAQLLATWVVHDLNHMGQIVRTMAKVYTDAVGPWSVYLAILQDRE